MKLIKYLCRFLGRFLFLIFKPFFFIFSHIKLAFIEIRSGYVSCFLKKAGENVLFWGTYRIIGGRYITIGDNFSSLYGLRFEAFDRYLKQVFNPNITIGDNVNINTDCHIACINKVVIGNDVLIASRVFITDHYHGEIGIDDSLIPSDRKLYSKGGVEIGNNVLIGEGVAILSNVKIGDNCVIGANSVVNRSFPRNSVIAGVPAKLIKQL